MKNSHLRYIAQFLLVLYLCGVQVTGPDLACCLTVDNNLHSQRIAGACSLPAGDSPCTSTSSCRSIYIGETGTKENRQECECRYFPITPDYQKSSITQRNPPPKDDSLTAVIPTFSSPDRHLLTARAFDLACLQRTNIPPRQSLSALRTIVIRC